MQKERYYGSATKNVTIIDRDPPVAFSIAEATNYTEELKDASADVKQRYHFYGTRAQATNHYPAGYLDGAAGAVGDIIYAETGSNSGSNSGGTPCSAGYYRAEGPGDYGNSAWLYTYIGTTFGVTDGVTLKGSTTDSASGINKYYFSKDDGKTWEPSNGQTGTSYTLKGLTGGTTYTLKMKAVDKAGNERVSNAVTKILPFTAADIASSSNVVDYFGAKITGHNCAANSSGIGWKMYYADHSNIYLIADNYIPSNLAPRTNSGYTVVTGSTNYSLSFGNVAKDYAGSSAITDPRLKRLNSSYYELLASHNVSNTTKDNIKATAYLLDSSKWMASFGSTKVEYAIGAPTLELLLKSYNQKYGSNFIARAHLTTRIGYLVSSDNGNSFGEGFTMTKGNGLYWLSDTSKAAWDWIASPSYREDTTSLYYINSGGYSHVAAHTYSTIGLRPVICLKSNIQLEKTGNGVYTIK